MHDVDVRRAMRRRLDESYADKADTRIVEELGIWAHTVRIDLAVINGEFHGIELKSARDTLERLPNQAMLYNEVFDRVTLVVADKHFCKALDLVPLWWGIMTAVSCEELGVRIDLARPAGMNPSINPVQIARLFWKTEAIAVLEKYGIARGFRSKPTEAIAQRLASDLPIDCLRSEARQALKSRPRLGQPVADVRNMSI
jgi:hypothetical protein